jgi:thioesterase domain-containing protein
MHQSDDGRPARYTTVSEIAAHYLSEIESVKPEGPYFLGGYCFGGLVAFEIAQKLRKRGEAVPLLVLLAPDAPSNVSAAGVSRQRELEPFRVTSEGKPWMVELGRRLTTFKNLNARDKTRYISAWLAGRIGVYLGPAKLIAEKLLCRICLGLGYRLPIWLRSYYILDIYARAARSYVPEPYPGPVIIFAPMDDPLDLEPWRRLTSAGFEICKIPGNHTGVLSSGDDLKTWAEVLSTRLQRVSGGYAKSRNDSAAHHVAPVAEKARALG